MQFTNPASLDGPVTVDGGTIDSVTDVINPISTDPNSTVAIVSTSVPFAFRDTFFWPTIANEQFAPSFSGVSYGFQLGRPVYRLGGTAGNVTNCPQLPRIGYNGRKNVRFTCVAFADFSNSVAGVLNDIAEIRLGNAYIFKFNRLANIAGATQQYSIECTSNVSGSSGVIATINSGDVHAFSIEVTEAGDVTFFIDGVQVAQFLAEWPATATNLAVQWAFRQGATASVPWIFNMSTPSISWI